MRREQRDQHWMGGCAGRQQTSVGNAPRLGTEQRTDGLSHLDQAPLTRCTRPRTSTSHSTDVETKLNANRRRFPRRWLPSRPTAR